MGRRQEDYAVSVKEIMPYDGDGDICCSELNVAVFPGKLGIFHNNAIDARGCVECVSVRQAAIHPRSIERALCKRQKKGR